MIDLFNGCFSLRNLPDISKWNTSNVINMSYMFNQCSSLSYIPDISKWNVTKLKNIDCIFQKCSRLISFPDISKWNIQTNMKINNIFNINITTSSISKIISKSLDNLSSKYSDDEPNNLSNKTIQYNLEPNNLFFSNDNNLSEYYDNFYK